MLNLNAVISWLSTVNLIPEEGRALLVATRAAVSRDRGIVVQGRNVDIDVPEGGYVVQEEWAIGGADEATWYATLDAARGAMVSLGDAHDRRVEFWDEPNQHGIVGHVDLTAPGCHTSRALIYLRDRWVAHRN